MAFRFFVFCFATQILTCKMKRQNLSDEPAENTFDYLIQKAVERALLNVTEPLIENVVERVINQKLFENKDEPLNIEQAAAFIHKKKQTVYNYCSKNLIPFHKNGNHVIFFRSELIEWMKSPVATVALTPRGGIC